MMDKVQILTEIIDEVAPNKEIRISNRTDPSITNEILHIIELRDKAARTLKTNRHDNELREEFNRLRNKTTRDIK